MRRSSIQNDIQYLAGFLPHRGPNTQNERKAAEYILDRMRSYAPQAIVDEFYSLDSPHLLLGSFYAEFLFVALIAMWFPWIAFVYGTSVFLLYAFETNGYAILSRLLPQYESQNVLAQFLADRPERLVIVAAPYDAPRATPLHSPEAGKWIPWVHAVLALCMFAVVGSCLVEGMGVGAPNGFRYDLLVRWGAAGVLAALGGGLLLLDFAADFLPGANDNASGAAALLALTERLSEAPLHNADVWVVGLGSVHGWMGGFRHLLRQVATDEQPVHLLLLSRVGEDGLRYRLPASGGPGRLFPQAVRSTTQAAESAPSRNHAWPDCAALASHRGIDTIEITSCRKPSGPRTHTPAADSPWGVNGDTVAEAVRFSESLLRSLDA